MGLLLYSEEQIALAVAALKKCGFRYGMYLYITGCDALAKAIAAVANRSGAAGIVLAAATDEQEQMIQDLGYACYRYGDDPVVFAKQQTNGRFYDLAFETTGQAQAYTSLINAVKRGAVIGVMAHLKEGYTFLVKTAVRSQLRFIGIKKPSEEGIRIAAQLIEREKCNTTTDVGTI